MSSSHASSAVSSASPAGEKDNVSSLLEMLGQVRDPRSPRGKRHTLVFVLAVCVVAVLAGAKNYRQMASQVADLPQSLLGRLGGKWCVFLWRFLWPSEPTIRRVVSGIDAGELDAAIGVWLRERVWRESETMVAIAIDGKVLRGSWFNDHVPLVLFSAMVHQRGVPVAQIRVPEETNEITQVRALLDPVTVPAGQRVLVTMDAAHTQRDTAEYIAGERGWDYVMTIKGNQPALLEAAAHTLRPLLRNSPDDVVTERGHGRVNRWSIWTTEATGINFPHGRRVACIRRDEFGLDGIAISKEIVYSITSARAEHASAAALNIHTRQHWGIENKVHYVRDVVWNEDGHHAYAGNGPQVMAALRNFALGLFRLHGINKITEATETISRDRTRALSLLTT